MRLPSEKPSHVEKLRTFRRTPHPRGKGGLEPALMLGKPT